MKGRPCCCLSNRELFCGGSLLVENISSTPIFSSRPQVLHWVRVFGRDNVMVVDSADLKSNPKETIEVRGYGIGSTSSVVTGC